MRPVIKNRSLFLGFKQKGAQLDLLRSQEISARRHMGIYDEPSFFELSDRRMEEKRAKLREHPCYNCPYATSIADGTRLFLPLCPTKCLRGYKDRPYPAQPEQTTSADE